MTRYARNSEFLDQIYYAIGNLYLSRGDTAQALENYKTAVEKSTRNGIDKALAQLALGNLYFNRGEYVKAQPCYAEAVPQLPETYPDYKMLKRRSDVLDELALYAGNVELQRRKRPRRPNVRNISRSRRERARITSRRMKARQIRS